MCAALRFLFILIVSEPSRAELMVQVCTCLLPVWPDSKEVGNVESSNAVLNSFSNLENRAILLF